MNGQAADFFVGKHRIPVNLIPLGIKIGFQFSYHKPLIDEIKNLEGARWNGGMWTANLSWRNRFALRLLTRSAQAERYFQPAKIPESFKWRADPWGDQAEFLAHVLAKRRVVIAAEVGTGKTFPVIEAADYIQPSKPLYVTSKTGILATNRELRKWGGRTKWTMLTYEGFKRAMMNWEGAAPDFVVFDESTAIKSMQAARTKAALHLSHGMEAEYHDETEFVVVMSGSATPKDYTDWWSQCEVARPGFIREPNIYKFRERLGVYQMLDGDFGRYPKLLQWRDGKECKSCLTEEATELDKLILKPDKTCKECKGTGLVSNEIELLSRRLAPLVMEGSKKGLPDIRFEQVILDPSAEILRVADALVEASPSAIEALNILRQLSDGFVYDDDGKPDYVETPKDNALLQLLGHYDECRRGIVFGAYYGSIDRVCRVVEGAGWKVWKTDGRGTTTWDGRSAESAYNEFQDDREDLKICYVAHPGSGGKALTLTKSPWACFYSNSFNGEDRIQGEGRGHRPGMDLNKGFTVYDLFHLATDMLVWNNLNTKKSNQKVVMDEIRATLDRQKRMRAGL